MGRLSTVSALAIGAAILLSAPATAGTTVIAGNNFDAENGGHTAVDYRGFADFDVKYAPGTFHGVDNPPLDLVQSGDLGVTCAGGVGGCVDLRNSQMVSKNEFTFNAGDKIELSFDISGNQRGGRDGGLDAGFVFDSQEASLKSITSAGIWGNGTELVDPHQFFSGLSGGMLIASDQAFTTLRFSFIARRAGRGRIEFGDSLGVDGPGPILDNFLLTRTAGVPEPASWALMIAGFGLAGAQVRGRRRAATA